MRSRRAVAAPSLASAPEIDARTIAANDGKPHACQTFDRVTDAAVSDSIPIFAGKERWQVWSLKMAPPRSLSGNRVLRFTHRAVGRTHSSPLTKKAISTSGRYCSPLVYSHNHIWHNQTMTQVTIELPDQLAEQARKEGLLSPAAVQRLIEEAIRRRAGRRFLQTLDRLAAAEPRLTPEEIQAEIDAARRERRQRN
jgi:post-segregation antitoxin (ccd killing protein)